MKLGKEELQKIGLSVILLAALLYGYFNLLLGPLDTQEKSYRDTITDLGPKITRANGVIKAAHVLEKNAPAVNGTLDQIKSFIPEGAPVAWFPPRIAEFFKRQGIEKCTAHQGGESVDKDLPGFKKLMWTIDIPRVEVVPLAIAIAALENENPLWEITNLQIEASKETPQYQSAHIVVLTIVNNE